MRLGRRETSRTTTVSMYDTEAAAVAVAATTKDRTQLLGLTDRSAHPL